MTRDVDYTDNMFKSRYINSALFSMSYDGLNVFEGNIIFRLFTITFSYLKTCIEKAVPVLIRILVQIYQKRFVQFAHVVC